MKLREMNAAEFRRYADFSFQEFIKDLAISSQISLEEAKEIAGHPPMRTERDLWYLAESNGQDVGFFWIQLQKNGEAFGFDLYLEEAYRGRGFGRALMLEGRHILKNHGVKQLDICVFEKNDAARALYRSLGFIEAGSEPSRKQFKLRIEL